MSKKNKNKKGFTLIDSLVALFIFSVSVMAFYGAFSAGTKYLLEAKNRSWALSLANERMEIIRNLNYDDVGTIGGVPSGELDPDEEVSSGGKIFRVVTDVYYVDDDFDEVGSEDKNGVMTDYKIAKVSIFWGKQSNSERVDLISRFVPSGVEKGNPDEGTLVINILSQDGTVSDANVNVINNLVSPSVNLNRETDDNGQVYIPGAKQSIQTYKIIVSKDGYETVETMDPDAPGMTYVPYDKNGSVVAGSVNITNITINKLADLTISSISYAEEIVPNLQFSISGGRQLDDLGAVFNFNEEDVNTGNDGEIIFSDISPGNFNITLGSNPEGYEFISMGIKSPFALNPNEEKEISIKFAPKNLVWLKVSVSDVNGEKLSGAQIKISNGTGFEKTEITTEDGVAFFETDENFLEGEYNLEVSLEGYETETKTISVAEESREEIILEINED